MPSIIDDLDLTKKQPVGATGMKKLYAHVLLDRSGSMGDVREATVDAYNEYVNGLALTPGLDARISLTIFDSDGIDLIRDKVHAVDKASRLTEEEYIPRASTPLNDAIGKTVAAMLAEKPVDPVAFVILTDGLENASREYTTPGVIKALLERIQKENNWLVLFLAANVDAFHEGVTARGTKSGHTMGFDQASMKASLHAASRATGSYGMTGDLQQANFTDEEREAAAKKTI
jgi:hypothetical protein